MKTKTDSIYFKGIIHNRSDSNDLLFNPGDLVIVKRGIERLIILRCPCGCGDDLLINLDKRAGKAWRLYSKFKSYTLYPSYWRDNGCHSHFILWDNKIYWFGRDIESNECIAVSKQIENKILEVLKEDEFTHYLDLADECGLDPWECLQACKQISKKGLCKAKKGKYKEYFKKTNPKSRKSSFKSE